MIGLLIVRAFCSNNQPAMDKFAPAQMIQVIKECSSDWPVAQIAQIVGRYPSTRAELNRVNDQVSSRMYNPEVGWVVQGAKVGEYAMGANEYDLPRCAQGTAKFSHQQGNKFSHDVGRSLAIEVAWLQ
jgi:hypothetical protein